MFVTEKDVQVRKEIYNDYIREAERASLLRYASRPDANHLPRIAKWIRQFGKWLAEWRILGPRTAAFTS